MLSTLNHDLESLRKKLRGYAFRRGEVKMAELGGSQDAPFEQAFSNLAHAYIKDKAPKLLDFEVGFQLLEKNQENTKAVGVFGFKVGNQWLYAPVFFLNGELKGHELLYVKSQDAFVPLKENWLNYLLGRRPSVLGDDIDRNLSHIGVMPPYLNQLARSPSKFAGASAPHMSDWFRDFLPNLSYLAFTSPEKDEKFTKMAGFDDFVMATGRPTLEFLLTKVAQQYPIAFQGIDRFYPGLLDRAAAKVNETEKQAKSNSVLKQVATGEPFPDGWNGGVQNSSVKNGGLFSSGPEAWESVGSYKRTNSQDARFKNLRKKASVLDGLLDPAPPRRSKVQVFQLSKISADEMHKLPLDQKEREELVTKGYVVKDDRFLDDTSQAYNVQEEAALHNPTETGIYDVLVKPGGFERCLVVCNPYSHKKQEQFCTVIRLGGESKRNWINTHPGNVFVRSVSDRDAYHNWFKDLKGVQSLPTSKRYDAKQKYVLIGPKGEGTVPFHAYNEYKGDEKEGQSEVYDVRFDCWARDSDPAWIHHTDRDYDRAYRVDPPQRFGPYPESERIVLSKRPGTRMRVHNGELYVPDGCKILQVSGPDKVEEEKKKKDEMGCCVGESMDGEGQSKAPPIRPGKLHDIHLALVSHTQPLKIFSDGRNVKVNDASAMMDKESALLHLIVDHGFTEKVAAELIRRADQARLDQRSQVGRYDCWVKYAAPGDPIGDMARGAPNAPGFPDPNYGNDPLSGGQIPTMNLSEQEIPVTEMGAHGTDRNVYDPRGPDPRSMAIAQEAAQSGQREVFDTAMLGGLLKTLRRDNMIDRYLGDIMKGLDRVGRILFLFYWHGEEFEDQYGKQDMPELEDGLRNAFEGMGDVVLKLKSKSIEPGGGEEGTDVDLSQVADN